MEPRSPAAEQVLRTADAEHPAEQPYRAATETALERAIHAGPQLPAVPASRPRSRYLLVALAVLLLPLLKLVGGAVLLVGLLTRGRTLARERREFAMRLAAYPLAVGPPAAWIRHGHLAPGPLELVLRERHPLAESAVRLAEPEAAFQWRTASTLRVSPRWGHDREDLPRLDRLIALLAAHRDELGLERIELVPP